MLHLYWGDGKGKTTAAMGLALRALGHGRRVVILQFLKDGSSGEIEMLRRCGAVVYACPNAKFTWLMTDAERAEARRTNTRTLQTILQGSFDLLVLDEACAACKNDLVEEALLREAAARAEQGAEVVLTGREPAAWMQDAADYSTELRAVKHPYTRGIAARFPVQKRIIETEDGVFKRSAFCHSVSTTATSLTFVPVGPVMIRPPTACKAW